MVCSICMTVLDEGCERFVGVHQIVRWETVFACQGLPQSGETVFVDGYALCAVWVSKLALEEAALPLRNGRDGRGCWNRR